MAITNWMKRKYKGKVKKMSELRHGTIVTVIMSTLIALGFCERAEAQPADVSWFPVSGTYTAKAQMGPDADTAEFCVVRVDLEPVIEYGCVPAGPNEIVTMDFVVVVTADIDAQIRGYAKDTGGRRSLNSPNMAKLDFTNPSAPVLVP